MNSIRLILVCLYALSIQCMTVMSDDDLTDKLIHELTEKNKEVKAIKDYNLKDKKGLFETAALEIQRGVLFSLMYSWKSNAWRKQHSSQEIKDTIYRAFTKYQTYFMQSYEDNIINNNFMVLINGIVNMELSQGCFDELIHNSHLPLLTYAINCNVKLPLWGNNIVDGSDLEAIAIGTYTIYQILFLLNLKIDARMVNVHNINAESWHYENILHLTSFNHIKDDIIKLYLMTENVDVNNCHLSEMSEMEDCQGWTANDLYQMYVSNKSNSKYPKSIIEYVKYRVNGNSKDDNIVNQGRFLEIGIDTYIDFSMLIMATLITMVLFITQCSRLITSIKLTFITVSPVIISLAQFVNQYLQNSELYSEINYSYKNLHATFENLNTCLSYFYCGIVLLLILNHLSKIATFRDKVYGHKNSYYLVRNNSIIKLIYRSTIILMTCVAVLCSSLSIIYDNQIIHTLSKCFIIIMLIMYITSLKIYKAWKKRYVKMDKWESILSTVRRQYRLQWLFANYLLFSTLSMQSFVSIMQLLQISEWNEIYTYLIFMHHIINMIVLIILCYRFQKKDDDEDNSVVFPVYSTAVRITLPSINEAEEKDEKDFSAEIREACVGHLNEDGLISPNTMQKLIIQHVPISDSQSYDRLANIVDGYSIDQAIYLIKNLASDSKSLSRHNKNVTDDTTKISMNKNTKNPGIPMLSIASNKQDNNNGEQNERQRSKSANLAQLLPQRRVYKYNQRIRDHKNKMGTTKEEPWYIHDDWGSNMSILTESESTEIQSALSDHWYHDIF